MGRRHLPCDVQHLSLSAAIPDCAVGQHLACALWVARTLNAPARIAPLCVDRQTCGDVRLLGRKSVKSDLGSRLDPPLFFFISNIAGVSHDAGVRGYSAGVSELLSFLRLQKPKTILMQRDQRTGLIGKQCGLNHGKCELVLSFYYTSFIMIFPFLYTYVLKGTFFG